MTDEYTKLKTVLQQTDMIVEEMRKERDVLRGQVSFPKDDHDLKYLVSEKYVLSHRSIEFLCEP